MPLMARRAFSSPFSLCLTQLSKLSLTFLWFIYTVPSRRTLCPCAPQTYALPVCARGLFAIAKEKAKEELIAGDLVFRHNGEKITHVGVYIGSGYAVDARGRDSGVIKQRLDAAGWNRFASLEMLNEQGISAVDAAMPSYGRCTGKSVYVRSGAGGTYPILATAHRGDRLLALPEQNGWHRIAICCKGKLLTGYMSAKYIEYA